MLVFISGQIVGADPSGFVLDGKYSESERDTISVTLAMKSPPNVVLIQGGSTGPQGEDEDLNFQMPRDFASMKFIRVETQRGPMNVRFVKLRDLPPFTPRSEYE